jgi:hypothetical protein
MLLRFNNDSLLSKQRGGRGDEGGKEAKSGRDIGRVKAFKQVPFCSLKATVVDIVARDQEADRFI